MKPINNTSDQASDYSGDLLKADTLEKLLKMLNDYRSIAADALDSAPKNNEEFAEFRKGLAAERKGKFHGETFAEKYGAILMPEVIFRVGFISSLCCVPWGLAFIRAKECGRIIFDDSGVARWIG